MNKFTQATEQIEGPPFKRAMYRVLLSRLGEPRKFMQVLSGPRQSGKTTLARQAIDDCGLPAHYATADEPSVPDREWLVEQWEIGRRMAREGGGDGGVLVLDEVQKIPGWASTVKARWDEDSYTELPLRVMVLGSAPLLVQRGLGESLTGRFELIRVPHWSFAEMREAFGFTLDQYLYFGGYPAGAKLIDDEQRWRPYVLNSILETTLSRDVILLSRIDKPALLRQLLRLACDYSGQILSYNKMVGELEDARHPSTLAHYLELLSGAGMVTGLQKYSGSKIRMRASSPKLQVFNTALISATSNRSMEAFQNESALWGRLVESAVGAHLLNSRTSNVEVFYWRDGNREVDYVLSRGRDVLPIEVTARRAKRSLGSMEAFAETYGTQPGLLVGGQGVPVERFLERPAEAWFA